MELALLSGVDGRGSSASLCSGRTGTRIGSPHCPARPESTAARRAKGLYREVNERPEWGGGQKPLSDRLLGLYVIEPGYT